jgi:hypothetical protein
MLVLLGGVGAYLSWLWLQIHQRATFLQNYSRFRASVFEKAIGEEAELFAKSYKIASAKKGSAKIPFVRKAPTDEELDEAWKSAYDQGEWKEKRDEWYKQFNLFNEKGWKEAKKEDSGSLRKSLDHVYIVFFVIWILLSLLGVAILLT